MSLHAISICGAIAVSAPADQPLLGIRHRLAQGPITVDFLDMDTGQILPVRMVPAEAAPARSCPAPQPPSD